MRIGIIGAGISGLSAAYYLSRAGHHVEVFEQSDHVGGLVSTFDLNGLKLERYYHFLCAIDDGYVGLCRELGLDNRIRWVRSRTGFFYNGVEYPFTTPLDLLRFRPIPLTQRIRFGVFALEARMRREWRQLDDLTAKPWLIDRLGHRAYEVIWHPLLSMKFGEAHSSISAAWVWHRLHRVALSKGRMGYLDGGSQLLFDALVNRIQSQHAKIHLNQAVKSIQVSNDAVTGLVLHDGTVWPCERIISTVPLSLLSDLLPRNWHEYAQSLRRIEYIGVVCVVLQIKRPVSRYFWYNVNDPSVPFNGIIEYTNLNPLGKQHGHILYVPFYVPTSHPLYQETDETVFSRSWQAVKTINHLLNDSDLLTYRVFRSPNAQAVCPTGFLKILPEHHAPIRGLHLLDSTFIYPEDRTQSRLILHARDCASGIIANE